MTAPTAGLDFDPARLGSFLATALPDMPTLPLIERIGGGQSNPTYYVTGGPHRLVLRKQPPGDHPRGAHNVGREFRILRALQDSAVPVPRTVLFHEARDIVGTPFFLMDRVDGRIFANNGLPSVPRDERRAYYHQLAQGLATIHAVDVNAADLGSLRRHGSFLGRQIDIWATQWGSLAATDPDVAHVVDWLRAHRIEDVPGALVHGDYKFHNMILAPHEPQLLAVLDWELCTIGDPLCDLAHLWALIWMTQAEEFGGLLGQDLAALGLPDAEEFFGIYYEYANTTRRVTRFHRVLALFRLAAIFHGIRLRAAQGRASADDAAEKGLLDRVYLDRAWAVAV